MDAGGAPPHDIMEEEAEVYVDATTSASAPRSNTPRDVLCVWKGTWGLREMRLAMDIVERRSTHG